MYAVVRAGSKQQKVAVGDVINIDKTEVAQGETLTLPVVMVVDGSRLHGEIWVLGLTRGPGATGRCRRCRR